MTAANPSVARRSRSEPTPVDRSPIGTRLLDIISAIADSTEKTASERAPRLADLAVTIGAALRLPRARLEQLYYAALLHGMGPGHAFRASLDRYGRPTTESKVEIDKRLKEFNRFFDTVPYLEGCRDIIAHVYEHFDGTGYPKGAKENTIPIESRIIQVADAFEGVTAQRYYRSSLSPEPALERLAIVSGTQLDPGIVRYLGSHEGRLTIDHFLLRTVTPQTWPLHDFVRQAAAKLRGHIYQAPREQPARPAAAPAFIRRYRLKIAGSLALALAVISGSLGLASASQDTVPGDTLYPAKRAIEDVRLFLTPHGDELGLHLTFAGERLSEAETLIAEGKAVPESLVDDIAAETEVLATYLADLEAGNGYELALQLRAHGQQAMAVLASLDGTGGNSPDALVNALARIEAAQGVGASVIAAFEGLPPADAGPPDEAGPPPNAGPPPDAGAPGDAGPPPNAGPPPDAGPPADAGPPPDVGPPAGLPGQVPATGAN